MNMNSVMPRILTKPGADPTFSCQRNLKTNNSRNSDNLNYPRLQVCPADKMRPYNSGCAL